MLLTGTVVAAPIGLGLIQFSKFLLAPFGQTMIRKSTLGVEQNKAWLAYSWLVTIIYFPFGLLCAAAVALEVAALCLTIIGIPLAIIVAKCLGTYFNPVNKICVSSKVAEELSRRAALEYIERKTAPHTPRIATSPVAAAPAVPVLQPPSEVAINTEGTGVSDMSANATPPDSPAHIKWQAFRRWASHPIHAAQSAAWTMFSLAILALVFALGRTATLSWPFWLSLAILLPAGFLAVRGPRTQGIILLCVSPLLALLFTLRGVVLPTKKAYTDTAAVYPSPAKPTEVPAPEVSITPAPPEPAALPPPRGDVAILPTPASRPTPADIAEQEFEDILRHANSGRDQKDPQDPPSTPLRVDFGSMDSNTGTSEGWIITAAGKRLRLGDFFDPKDFSVGPGGQSIVILERVGHDALLLRLFSRLSSGEYEERKLSQDWMEAVPASAGYPAGDPLDRLNLTPLAWESSTRLRLRADGRKIGGYSLENWQGYVDMLSEEEPILTAVSESSLPPMSEHRPGPEPANSKISGLSAKISNTRDKSGLKCVVVNCPGRKDVIIASLPHPLAVSVGPEGHYIAVEEEVGTDSRIVKAFKRVGELEFREVPTESYYKSLPIQLATETLGRPDICFDKCFCSIVQWDSPNQLRVVAYARKHGEPAYSLESYDLVLNLDKFSSKSASHEHPKDGRATPQLVQIMPDGTEKTIPLQKELKLPEGWKSIPLTPEDSASLNPQRQKANLSNGNSTVHEPAPPLATGNAARQDVDAATFESLTSFVKRHYLLASQRRVKEQMADYAEYVTLFSKLSDTNEFKESSTTREKLLTEELADDQKFESVTQRIESPIKAGYYPAHGIYVVTYLLSIESNYRKRIKPPYNCRARIDLVLKQYAGGWRILKRYTSVLPSEKR